MQSEYRDVWMMKRLREIGEDVVRDIQDCYVGKSRKINILMVLANTYDVGWTLTTITEKRTFC